MIKESQVPRQVHIIAQYAFGNKKTSSKTLKYIKVMEELKEEGYSECSFHYNGYSYNGDWYREVLAALTILQ